MLTNREIATIILFVLLAAFVLSKRSVRESVAELVKAFLAWKMLLVFFAYVGYATVVIWLAWQVGIWDTAILKDTVIWAFFTGLPIVFRASQIRSNADVMRRAVVEALAVSTFVALYVNLHSFAIGWEIVLQVTFALLGVIEVAARHQGNRARPVANVNAFLLLGLAIFMMWRTGTWLIDNWSKLDHDAILMLLGMTVWLPFALLPYVYIFAFVVHSESSLTMVRFFNREKRLRLSTILAFLFGTRFSVRYSGNFSGGWRSQLARSETFREALKIMGEYRQSLGEEEAAERAAATRLRDYAGVDGVDSDGRRLDRREFEDTQKALSYLWSCMLGHARNRNNRYRDDLLPWLDFQRHGLAANGDHGITVKVAKDKRAWYGWRRTVTGWVFGIGGNQENLAARWRYDGAEAPNEYPGNGSTVWSNELVSDETAKNWD
jgi:hypothetical protein